MRYTITKITGLALLVFAPVLLGAPTGLKALRQELTYGPTLGARIPPPRVPPPVRPGAPAGGAAGEAGLGGSGGGLGRGGGGLGGGGGGLGGGGAGLGGSGGHAFVPEFLPDAAGAGYSIEVVDFSEPGWATQPGDPKVGTLYKVTNPAYENGEYSVDEIGVNKEAKSVAIGDADNDADALQNPNALSLSEITMNVWSEVSGESTTAIQSIYIKDIANPSTAGVLRSGHSLMGSQEWTIEANTVDPNMKAIFDQLTTRETAFGGAVNKMTSNWIGKSVSSVQVERFSITYYLT